MNHDDPIPEPGAGGEFGRVPKSLQARLSARAAQVGGSIDTLVVVLLAEGVGARAPLAA